MDWWQVGSVVVAMVASSGGAVGFMWRAVRTETGTLREENRKAHEQIGIAISDVRKELGGEIADLREGQASLREGIAGLQGEMNGMHHAILTLREDFRAHVLADD